MSLQLSDITLSYPDGGDRLIALDRVSLSVPRGGITMVVGPSGSGKSSLLAVAATLIAPDSGEILLDGEDLARLRPRQAAAARRDRIGIVFQSANLLSALTALDQLLLVANLSGIRPAAARRKALALLDAVGLADQAHRRPHQLSGGQRQRVSIARGLMNDPALLLVDEPTSALDSARGEQVLDLIQTLTVEKNLATMMVTHDQRQLTRAAQVAEIGDGRLAAREVVAPG